MLARTSESEGHESRGQETLERHSDAAQRESLGGTQCESPVAIVAKESSTSPTRVGVVGGIIDGIQVNRDSADPGRSFGRPP